MRQNGTHRGVLRGSAFLISWDAKERLKTDLYGEAMPSGVISDFKTFTLQFSGN